MPQTRGSGRVQMSSGQPAIEQASIKAIGRRNPCRRNIKISPHLPECPVQRSKCYFLHMNKFLILLSVVVLAACNGFRSIKTAFRDRSPHETYIESLKKAELLNASMTQEWLQASEAVFLDSVFVNVPHSESGFFQASSPEARSFRFNVKDGQVLTVNGLVKTHGDANVFLDLFIRSGTEWDHIAYGDSTLSITHEFGSDEECVLRIQPELLVNAWFSVTISLTPVLLNPVFGASNRSIGSFYGASRDNGK